MPLLIIYIIKLSISLAVVYLFYQLLLRRLTFYNCNRWYLLGYTLLCFFIPLINIASFAGANRPDDNAIIRLIPAIETYTGKIENNIQGVNNAGLSAWDRWDWMTVIIAAGIGFLLLRFFILFFSFLRLRKKADLISSDTIMLYHINEPVIPFSFGKSVFINKELHSDTELQEIIRHEFVHVKQRHTIDIIWTEIICILNWYNPFVWLLKAAIRQNLEFIADNKVLENGIQKKQYQYLLLKVMGSDQYSIAQKFNFSSLKKRIAMMNKLKTAKVHLLRFLFILPFLALILVSFRQKKQDRISDSNNAKILTDMRDTIPRINEKGYVVEVTGNRNNSIVIVKDRNGRLVEKIPYSKWKENESSFIDKYGEYPAPHLPPTPPTPPSPPEPMEMPENVKKINVDDKKATVILKDGTIEKYDLSKPEEKEKFEKKYGDIIPPPPLPPVKPGNIQEVSAVKEVHPSEIADDFEINEDHKARMHLKDGTVEVYDLNNAKEKKVFEDKYGKVIEVPTKVEGVDMPVEAISVTGVHAVLAPVKVGVEAEGVRVIDDNGDIVGGQEEILITITKKTTREQIDGFVRQMKEKGVYLKINNTTYNDGVLTHIDGVMKEKRSENNFSATDFNRVILSRLKNKDQIFLQVKVSDKNEVI